MKASPGFPFEYSYSHLIKGFNLFSSVECMHTRSFLLAETRHSWRNVQIFFSFCTRLPFFPLSTDNFVTADKLNGQTERRVERSEEQICLCSWNLTSLTFAQVTE